MMVRHVRTKRARSGNGGRGSIALALCLLVSAPEPLLAYLDPGTGSMLVQVTIGAIAAGLTLKQALLEEDRGLLPLTAGGLAVLRRQECFRSLTPPMSLSGRRRHRLCCR